MRERAQAKRASDKRTDVDASAPDPGKQTRTQGIQRKTAPRGDLPDGVRAQMETSLGADFSDVRVHVDGKAEAMGAQAFASGDDLHFAQGKFDPGSQAGKELIGHELTHVVQQRTGRTGAGTSQGKGLQVVDDPALEAEADAMGARAAAGEVTGLAAGASAASDSAAQLKPDAAPAKGGEAKESPGEGGGGSPPAGALGQVSAAIKVVGDALALADKLKSAFDQLNDSHRTIYGTVPLPQLVTTKTKEALQGIERYEWSRLITEKAIKLGLKHHIDFRQPDRAQRAPAPAGGTKDAAANHPANQPGTAPAKEAPTPPAHDQLEAEDVNFKELMNGLRSLSGEQQKSEAKQAFLERFHEGELEPASFWWNVDDEQGYNDQPVTTSRFMADPDWGLVKVKPVFGKTLPGALSGIHPDANLFGLVESPPKPANHGWWNGGGCDIESGGMQSLTVEARPKPDLDDPDGGFELISHWDWDASSTKAAGNLRAGGNSAIWVPKPDGKPDFGWWR